MPTTAPASIASPAAPAADPGPAGTDLRRNCLGLVCDGGLCAGGMAFIAAETVLPNAMASLGAPNALIALAPILVTAGFIWPQALVAHRIERLRSFKRTAVLLGALQRVPYLIAGLALLLLGEAAPWAGLACLALAPFLFGTIGGIQVGAYLSLARRVLPDDRRASCMAYGAVFASVLGLAAGGTIHAVLSAHPGATGYGILHLLAFGCMLLSLLAMAAIREPPAEADGLPARRTGLREHLASLPGLLRMDRSFRSFVILRSLLATSGLASPFLALHALQTTGADAGFLGLLVAWQTAGAILGNLCSGWLGDRRGAGWPLALGTGIMACSLLAIACVAGTAGFQVLFLAYGFGSAAIQIGVRTFGLAIAPEGRLPTYASLGSLLTLPAMLASALAAGALREAGVPLPLVAAGAGLLMLVALRWLPPDQARAGCGTARTLPPAP